MRTLLILMLNFGLLNLGLLNLGILPGPPAAKASESGPSESQAQHRIFELAPDASVAEVARDHGLTVEKVYHHALHGFVGTLPPGMESSFELDPRIVRSEIDQTLVLTDQIESDGHTNWGLDRIDQRSLPLDGVYQPDGDGDGVTAYIIDTGIRYDHREFEGRASFGWDAGGGDGRDCNGHGTHIAGIIGGRTFGVAKKVKLVSVAVMPCRGGGALSDLIAGVDWVTANHRGPSVANLSILTGGSALFDDAVRRMIESGVATAVAAGNQGGDACAISPGRIPEAMNVGASDIYDHAAIISNFGPCVSWFAPGVNIVSASILSPVATLAMTGTSMAAPHTAGVAALYLQKRPWATPEEVKHALASDATKGIVYSPRTNRVDLLYCGDLPSRALF